jgi:hypothetical protein
METLLWNTPIRAGLTGAESFGMYSHGVGASMDDMTHMSFDELRECLHPAHEAHRAAIPVIHVRATHHTQRGMRTHALPLRTRALPLSAADGPRELDVYLHGPRAGNHVTMGVSCLDAQRAEAMCKGRRDFVLFEELASAVREQKRLVFVVPFGAPCCRAQVQVYYARSLGRWLSEEKTDGTGRPYREMKDEDPTLRKKFTKAQIAAVLSFAGFSAASAA